MYESFTSAVRCTNLTFVCLNGFRSEYLFNEVPVVSWFARCSLVSVNLRSSLNSVFKSLTRACLSKSVIGMPFSIFLTSLNFYTQRYERS